MAQTPMYLMSPPRKDWTLRGRANFKSELATPVNAERARLEWVKLANAIVEAGGEVIVLPPNPRENLTGMIYTAEAGEFYRDAEGRPRFLLPNMVPEHRRTEADWVGGFMEGLGIATTAVVAAWEAQGDVLRPEPDTAIHTFGTGKYKRTDARSYEEVAHLISPRHLQLAFQADPWFHGNTFLNFYHGVERPIRLGDNERARVPTIGLVCEKALVPGELDSLKKFLPHVEFVTITAEESKGYDTNSLEVNRTVIAPRTLSATARAAFQRLELRLVELELDELFAKGGGAPVCLTNRLYGLTTEEVPGWVRWSLRPRILDHTDV